MGTHNYFDSAFYPYVSWLVGVLKSEPNLAAWELFNEPDNGSVNQANMAIVLENLRLRVRAQDVTTPLVVSGGTVGLEMLNSYFDSDDWLRANIAWIGFHLQSVALYTGGDYSLSAPNVGYAGFPAEESKQVPGLLNAPTVQGALSFAYAFLQLHGLQGGFVEEACERSIVPQMFQDLDIACRPGGPGNPQGLGIMYLTSAYSPFAPWPMSWSSS